MADYSTRAQVASEFRDITFTATSVVKESEVDRFITEADAFINGIIGKRFEVPVLGATSLITLRQISIWLVAHRVSKILEVKTATEENDQGPKPISLRAMAMAHLKMIIKGELLLPDAVLLDSTDGIESFNSDNAIVPEFEKGVDQY